MFLQKAISIIVIISFICTSITYAGPIERKDTLRPASALLSANAVTADIREALKTSPAGPQEMPLSKSSSSGADVRIRTTLLSLRSPWDTLAKIKGKVLQRWFVYYQKSAVFTEDRKYILATDQNGRIYVLDRRNGICITKLDADEAKLIPAVFTPSGDIAAMVAAEPEQPHEYAIKLWGIDTKAEQPVLRSLPYSHKGTESSFKAMALSPDGKKAAVADDKGDCYIRNLALEHIIDAPIRLARTDKEKKEGIFSVVTFYQGAARLITVHNATILTIWDTLTGRQISQDNLVAKGLEGEITACSVSPNGAVLALGYVNGNIRLLDMDSGKVIVNLTGHTKKVNSIAFARDGMNIVTTAEDRTLRHFEIPDAPAFNALKTLQPQPKASSAGDSIERFKTDILNLGDNTPPAAPENAARAIDEAIIKAYPFTQTLEAYTQFYGAATDLAISAGSLALLMKLKRPLTENILPISRKDVSLDLLKRITEEGNEYVIYCLPPPEEWSLERPAEFFIMNNHNGALGLATYTAEGVTGTYTTQEKVQEQLERFGLIGKREGFVIFARKAQLPFLYLVILNSGYIVPSAREGFNLVPPQPNIDFARQVRDIRKARLMFEREEQEVKSSSAGRRGSNKATLRVKPGADKKELASKVNGFMARRSQPTHFQTARNVRGRVAIATVKPQPKASSAGAEYVKVKSAKFLEEKGLPEIFTEARLKLSDDLGGEVVRLVLMSQINRPFDKDVSNLEYALYRERAEFPAAFFTVKISKAGTLTRVSFSKYYGRPSKEDEAIAGEVKGWLSGFRNSGLVEHNPRFGFSPLAHRRMKASSAGDSIISIYLYGKSSKTQQARVVTSLIGPQGLGSGYAWHVFFASLALSNIWDSLNEGQQRKVFTSLTGKKGLRSSDKDKALLASFALSNLRDKLTEDQQSKILTFLTGPQGLGGSWWDIFVSSISITLLNFYGRLSKAQQARVVTSLTGPQGLGSGEALNVFCASIALATIRVKVPQITPASETQPQTKASSAGETYGAITVNRDDVLALNSAILKILNGRGNLIRDDADGAAIEINGIFFANEIVKVAGHTITYTYNKAEGKIYVSIDGSAYPTPVQDVGIAAFNKIVKHLAFLTSLASHMGALEQFKVEVPRPSSGKASSAGVGNAVTISIATEALRAKIAEIEEWERSLIAYRLSLPQYQGKGDWHYNIYTTETYLQWIAKHLKGSMGLLGNEQELDRETYFKSALEYILQAVALLEKAKTELGEGGVSKLQPIIDKLTTMHVELSRFVVPSTPAAATSVTAVPPAKASSAGEEDIQVREVNFFNQEGLPPLLIRLIFQYKGSNYMIILYGINEIQAELWRNRNRLSYWLDYPSGIPIANIETLVSERGEILPGPSVTSVASYYDIPSDAERQLAEKVVLWLKDSGNLTSQNPRLTATAAKASSAGITAGSDKPTVIPGGHPKFINIDSLMASLSSTASTDALFMLLAAKAINAELLEYPAGMPILKEGEAGSGRGDVFVVAEGEAEVVTGEEPFTRRYPIKVGEVIGEMGFLWGTARVADVISKGAKVFCLAGDKLIGYLQKNPKIASDIRRIANSRVQQLILDSTAMASSEDIVLDTHESVRKKGLTALLADIKSRFGEDYLHIVFLIMNLISKQILKGQPISGVGIGNIDTGRVSQGAKVALFIEPVKPYILEEGLGNIAQIPDGSLNVVFISRLNKEGLSGQAASELGRVLSTGGVIYVRENPFRPLDLSNLTQVGFEKKDILVGLLYAFTKPAPTAPVAAAALARASSAGGVASVIKGTRLTDTVAGITIGATTIRVDTYRPTTLQTSLTLGKIWGEPTIPADKRFKGKSPSDINLKSATDVFGDNIGDELAAFAFEIKNLGVKEDRQKMAALNAQEAVSFASGAPQRQYVLPATIPATTDRFGHLVLLALVVDSNAQIRPVMLHAEYADGLKVMLTILSQEETKNIRDQLPMGLEYYLWQKCYQQMPQAQAEAERAKASSAGISAGTSGLSVDGGAERVAIVQTLNSTASLLTEADATTLNPEALAQAIQSCGAAVADAYSLKARCPAAATVLSQPYERAEALLRMMQLSKDVAAQDVNFSSVKGTIVINDAEIPDNQKILVELFNKDSSHLRALEEKLGCTIRLYSQFEPANDSSDNMILISRTKLPSLCQVRRIDVQIPENEYLPLEQVVVFAKGLLTYNSDTATSLEPALSRLYTHLTGKTLRLESLEDFLDDRVFSLMLPRPVAVDKEYYDTLHRQAMAALIAA